MRDTDRILRNITICFTILLIMFGILLYGYTNHITVLRESNKINQDLVNEIHELRLDLNTHNINKALLSSNEFTIQKVFDPYYQNDVLSKLDSIKNEITKLLKVSLKHHWGERAGEEQYERFYR